MRITKRTVGDVVILDCEGKILIGGYGPDESMPSIVAALAADGWLKVLVNLAVAGNTSIDNAFLGDVVRSYTELQRKGGILKLLSPPKGFRDLLEETKLDQVFEVYYDEEVAIRGFA